MPFKVGRFLVQIEIIQVAEMDVWCSDSINKKIWRFMEENLLFYGK
jgi:hypothetical protein